MQRRRSAPHTFDDNIAAEKAKLEAQLSGLKPGPQSILQYRKKIRQLDTASHMSEWLMSPPVSNRQRRHKLRPLKPTQGAVHCYAWTATTNTGKGSRSPKSGRPRDARR